MHRTASYFFLPTPVSAIVTYFCYRSTTRGNLTTAMASMPETLPHKHRLAVGEYYRMAEAGILAPNARVELINGKSGWCSNPCAIDPWLTQNPGRRVRKGSAGPRMPPHFRDEQPESEENVTDWTRLLYVALYSFEEQHDTVLILAIRHQREAGYTPE